MGESSTTIRIAVIGSGLSAVTLLRGLTRYRHIAADMYESRPSFREERPGIELSDLAQDVLQVIDPSIVSCLDHAGAIYTGTDCCIGTGPLSGQRIDVPGYSNHSKRIVSRQALLSELLVGIPPRMVHRNTRIESIKEASPGNGLTLSLSDGTQKRFDVVIGADGIHGKIRAHVVGPDDPAQSPRPSGLWSLPIRVPVRRAQELMGAECLDSANPRQVTWIGNGTTMQYNMLDDGNEAQITLTGTFDATNQDFSWVKLFAPEEIQQIFSQNLLLPCQGLIKLVQSIYTVQIAGICQTQQVPTRTYVSSNAALICDSAHGMLSSHEALSGLALEEALVLVTLLGRTTSKFDIPSALRAYDEVCRPRAELVTRATCDTSLLMAGRAPGVGLNPTLLGKALQEKWDIIEGFDINTYCAAALSAMDRYSLLARRW